MVKASPSATSAARSTTPTLPAYSAPLATSSIPIPYASLLILTAMPTAISLEPVLAATQGSALSKTPAYPEWAAASTQTATPSMAKSAPSAPKATTSHQLASAQQ